VPARLPREIRFEKWEGLGNDFLVVDAATLAPDASDEIVRQLTDRRRGVGGDGVLFVERGSSPRMIVRNADGSRPEMCGNGLRCVAAHLAGLGGAREITVETDAGPRACTVLDGGDVAIDMGVAVLGDELVVEDAGEKRRFFRASMGNPHAITFEPEERATIDALAPIVEHAVPGRTNVEWVTDREGRLDVLVWERGVGYTEACGTGACAVAAVACARGMRSFDEEHVVALPGGDLFLRVGRDLRVVMRGPARKAFEGVLSLA
jgi:diaminopimelate epimerase